MSFASGSFASGSPDELAVYTGHDVVDEQGQRIGRVVDVIYDDDQPASAPLDPQGDLAQFGRQPSWLVVDPGLLRATHYLPVAGSYRTGDGTIVTPWDRDWVKAAAKAHNDHIMTKEQREQLLAHYSLAS